jgi:hypothetical protein
MATLYLQETRKQYYFFLSPPSFLSALMCICAAADADPKHAHEAAYMQYQAEQAGMCACLGAPQLLGKLFFGFKPSLVESYIYGILQDKHLRDAA